MADASRPNVLIYCTDQQRADLLGCMGHAGIRTPHLDALASRGVLLRNLFVQGTVCMPSRYSIMTGQYPGTHGVIDNGYERPYDTPTFATAFAEAGYHTAVVGRTHLRCSVPHPIEPNTGYFGWRECAHSQCYWPGLDPHGEYATWVRMNWPDEYEKITAANPIDRDDAHCASWWDIRDDQTMTAWATTRTLEMFRRHRARRGDQPLLVWTGVWDPHMRFVIPPPWDRMYDPADIPLPARREGELDDLPPHYRQLALTQWQRSGLPLDDVIRNTLSVYWGTISHIDDQFGRLMRGLDELGELENTIVLFISDHGEMAGEHWCWTKGPYSFDGAQRVPGIIAGPSLPAGREVEAFAELVDVAPTLLDLAGIDFDPADGGPAGLEMQGRSAAPALRGETHEHREDAFAEYQHLGHGEEQLMLNLRTREHHIAFYPGQRYGELYDRINDPDALRNRWDDPAFADVKQRMIDRLLHRVAMNHRRPNTRTARW